MSRSHYEVLGVARTATPEEIKAAYRAAAAELHPDKLQGLPARQRDALQEEMKCVNVAHDVLSDPGKRTAYDRGGAATSDEGEAGRRVIRSLVEEVSRQAPDLAAEGVRVLVKGIRRKLAGQ